MNKFMKIVMDDGWVHPLAKTLPCLVSILRWNIVMDVIEIWMKNHLVSDSNRNTINL